MMALFITLLCFLTVWELGPGNFPLVSYKELFIMSDSPKGTNSYATEHAQKPIYLDWAIHLCPDIPRDCPKLQSFLVLYEFVPPLNDRHCLASCQKRALSKYDVKQRLMIILLLLLSGNVQPNPGPELQCTQTPADFKSKSGLKFVHLNVRSLVPKMDMVRIWVKSTNADILIISETWLTKSITDESINIAGYNVFRTDRPKKGGGVAIFVKSRFRASIVYLSLFANKWSF